MNKCEMKGKSAQSKIFNESSLLTFQLFEKKNKTIEIYS